MFEMETDSLSKDQLKIVRKAISIIESNVQDLSPAEQRAVYSTLRNKFANFASNIKLPKVVSDDSKLATSTLSKVQRRLNALLSAHGFSRGEGNREWVRTSTNRRKGAELTKWENYDIVTLQKSKYSTNFTINLYSPKIGIPARVNQLKHAGADIWSKVDDSLDEIISDVETYALPWFEKPKLVY